MEEIWKPVCGYEGWYEVSSFGRVKRVRKGCATREGKILKPGVNKFGYQFVILSKNCKTKAMTVHGVVAKNFIGDRPEGMQVNHIDGKKINNCLSNLEYVSPSQNKQHAYNIGITGSGSRHYWAKLKDAEVINIKTRLRNGEMCTVIAKDYNVCSQTISGIKRGISWKHVA